MLESNSNSLNQSEIQSMDVLQLANEMYHISHSYDEAVAVERIAWLIAVDRGSSYPVGETV